MEQASAPSWSPGWLNVFQRVEVRKRLTFDSSATPKPGVTVKAPERLAPVDIEALRASLGEVIEKAKADDPKALRARIAALERELATKSAAAPDDGALTAARELGRVDVRLAMRPAFALLDEVLATVRKIEPQLCKANRHFSEGGFILMEQASAPSRPAFAMPSAAAEFGRAFEAAGRVAPKPSSNRETLNAGERKILTALAQYPGGRRKSQVGILAGYAVNGGGFNNYLSSLRTRGWLEGTGERLRITREGLTALGSGWKALPTGAELLRHWQGKLEKAPRAILEALRGGALDKESLGRATGYEPNGGGFNNALSRLRTLELIVRTGGGQILLAPELEG